jgi:putative ABC transport system permease protein
MAGRKLRSVLTAIAVLLGVAMIAGTYVLTDQMRSGFGELQDSVYSGVDAELAPKESFSSQFSLARPLDARLIGRVEEVPGVDKVQGDLWAPGALVIDGKLEKSTGGGGTIVTTSSEEPFSPATNVDGHMPEQSGEVALLRSTADKHDLEPGDHIGIATHSGTRMVTVSGVFDLGSTNAGGTDIVSARLDDIQRWFDRRGEVTTINVAAEEGVTPEELVDRLRPIAPPGVEVRTGQAAGNENAEEISDQIGRFLTPALLAFGGAALLVGAFIIFNTFTITVAERTREFALLRTLGSTRRQILGAVTLEALVIGAVASVAGLLVGLLFAKFLASMFEAVGLGLPTGALELAPRTIALSLFIGIGVTLVAAIAPARRATRVPPIAALQRSDQEETSKSRFGPWIAGVLAVLGIGLVVAGLFASGPASSRLSTMAVGIVFLFIGVALTARFFVRPVASAIGWPLERLFEEPGLLARENAMRNPGRTATTAAALMVGLGLVVFVAVFANGIKGSIDSTITDRVKADLVVASETMQPIPSDAEQAVAGVPEVETATGVLIDQVQVNSEDSSVITDIVNGVEPSTLPEVYDADWIVGGDEVLGRLGGNSVAIEEQFGKAHDLRMFDSFQVETPSGGKARLTVIGIYRDPNLLQGMIADRGLFQSISSARDPWLILVGARTDAAVADVKRDLDAAVKPFPVAEVDTQAEYVDRVTEQFNRLIYVLYALLAMCIVISLFGIANSLFLSIHERTREFGLLRAVGCTRSQIRQMVRYESIITAVIGGLLGTVIGIVFAYLVTESLGDLGLDFALPLGQLGVFLLLAVMVGIAAAALPARRGAKLQVLEALRAE